MILSDRDIKKELKSGRISIDPLFPKAIQPASVDLHLGADFLFFRTSDHVCIDPKEPIDQMMEASGLELNPLPGGNRQVKTKAWFNHANKSFPDPLSVLGNEISISV